MQKEIQRHTDNTMTLVDTLKYPVLVCFDEVHFNFRSAVTDGQDSSTLDLNCLRIVDQETRDESVA